MAAAARRSGPDPDMEKAKGEALNAIIGEQVMHVLGSPGDLLRVNVRQLWDGHYRVNVLVGPDIASALIADSYFVVADVDGHIINATPKIAKHY